MAIQSLESDRTPVRSQPPADDRRERERVDNERREREPPPSRTGEVDTTA